MVATSNSPAATGADEEKALTTAELGDATHLAVLYRDDAGNWGHLSSVALPTSSTPDPGGTGGGSTGDGGGTTPGGTTPGETTP